jgi:hypothetical protein
MWSIKQDQELGENVATNKFFPTRYYHDDFIQLQNLRQNNSTVEEYIREFE